MNDTDLFEIIGNIDGKYIAEAEAFSVPKGRTVTVLILKVAVAAAVIIAAAQIAVMVLPDRIGRTTPTEAGPTGGQTTMETGTGTGPGQTDVETVRETSVPGTIEHLPTTGVCLTEGSGYWMDSEAGYAFLMDRFDEIRDRLVSSGEPTDSLTIDSSGFTHIYTGDGLRTIKADRRQYLVFNGDDLIAVITVINGEGGYSYDLDTGETWFGEYGGFLHEHEGERLIYINADSIEAVITPDSRVWIVSDNMPPVDGLDGTFDYYGFYDENINGYTPHQ